MLGNGKHHRGRENTSIVLKTCIPVHYLCNNAGNRNRTDSESTAIQYLNNVVNYDGVACVRSTSRCDVVQRARGRKCLDYRREVTGK
jgi:hypothetical protein